MKQNKEVKVDNSWNGFLIQGMEDLTFEETRKIKGRGSEEVLHLIGYYLGKLGNLFS